MVEEPMRGAEDSFHGRQGIVPAKTQENSVEIASDTRRFAVILANMHGAILLVGNDGHVEFANKAFCSMFELAEAPESLMGLTASALLGRVWSAYANPTESVARIREIVSAARPVYDEEVLLTGERACWRDFTPLEVDGRPSGQLWKHRYIPKLYTEREKASLSEERFRNLVESTAGIVWEAEPETLQFTSISGNAERILGYPLQQWLAPGFWLSHIFPEDYVQTVEYCKESTARQQAHEFEYRFLAADGRIVWLLDRVVVVIEQGKPRWLRGVMLDITRQKAIEIQLQESEMRFRMLVEAAPVMIWMTDENRRYVYMNQAMRKFTGRQNVDDKAIAWADDVHPEDLPRLRKIIDAAFDLREAYVVEYRRRHVDGVYRWTRGNATPRFDPNRSFSGFIGTIVDIDDLRAAERLLANFNAELEHRVATRTVELTSHIGEIESMANLMSHDLRAPLVRLGGYTKVLLDEKEVQESPGAQAIGRRILDAVNKMDQLLEALTDHARIRAQAPAFKPVDLDKLVRGYIEEVRHAPNAASIDWETGPLSVVFGDEPLLRIVVQNLLENAIKYSSKVDKPHIEIAPVETAVGKGFYVRDNGAGFSMQYANRLFKPFARLHSDSEFPGSGIGLANVHRIVSRHGGAIWCSATPGKGATFFVTFPLLHADLDVTKVESK